MDDIVKLSRVQMNNSNFNFFAGDMSNLNGLDGRSDPSGLSESESEGESIRGGSETEVPDRSEWLPRQTRSVLGASEGEPDPHSNNIWGGLMKSVVKGSKIGIDQFTVTFDSGSKETLIEWAKNTWADWFEPCNGQNFYSGGLVIHNLGVRIQWGHCRKPDGYMLHVTGKGLSMFGADRVINIMRDLKTMGGKFTRNDIACDFFGIDVRAVEDVIASCDDDQNKVVRDIWDGEEPDGTSTGLTCYLGGKSADRRWCCYDKGLQTGELKGGEHQRIELRLRREYADQSVDLLLDAGENWASVAHSLVFDLSPWKLAPEFWYLAIDGIDGVHLKAESRKQSLASTMMHFKRTVLPKVVLMAEENQTGVDEILLMILDECMDDSDFRPADRIKNAELLRESVEWYTQKRYKE